MKLVSWNVNGLRSLNKGLAVTLKELDADIICFQETKIGKDMMTENLAIVDGYRSYFSYCARKSGYSGVVTYCKTECQPVAAVSALTAPLPEEDDLRFSLDASLLKKLDCEGRAVISQHRLDKPISSKRLVSVVNVYCPCVNGDNSEREQFRLQFLQLLEERIASLRKSSHVVLVGDMNIAHKIIDHCDPGDEKLFYDAPHRLWFDKLVGSDGTLVDSYRHFDPKTPFIYSCWNTRTGARQTNFGTRIDYILTDTSLLDVLQRAEVHSKYKGSDHCPVSAVIDLQISPSTVLPPLCSSHKYKHKQQKLTFFMKKRSAPSEPDMDSRGSKSMKC